MYPWFTQICSFNRVYNHKYVSPKRLSELLRLLDFAGVCPNYCPWSASLILYALWSHQQKTQLLSAALRASSGHPLPVGCELEGKVYVRGAPTVTTTSCHKDIKMQFLGCWKGKQAGCLHSTKQESNSWVIPGAGGVLHLYSCF